MKKLFVLAIFMFVASFGSRVSAQDILVGTYGNDAGAITITNAKNGENANYDVTIADKSGKCNIQIVAATNQVTAEGQDGAVFHPKAIVSVQSETYPNFSLWPEDQTIKLADDALPFDKLDPACQAFKNNMVFTRQQ